MAEKVEKRKELAQAIAVLLTALPPLPLADDAPNIRLQYYRAWRDIIDARDDADDGAGLTETKELTLLAEHKGKLPTVAKLTITNVDAAIRQGLLAWRITWPAIMAAWAPRTESILTKADVKNLNKWLRATVPLLTSSSGDDADDDELNRNTEAARNFLRARLHELDGPEIPALVVTVLMTTKTIVELINALKAHVERLEPLQIGVSSKPSIKFANVAGELTATAAAAAAAAEHSTDLQDTVLAAPILNHAQRTRGPSRGNHVQRGGGRTASQRPPVQQQQRVPQAPQTRTTPRAPPLWCSYCQAQGHGAITCYKAKADIARLAQCGFPPATFVNAARKNSNQPYSEVSVTRDPFVLELASPQTATATAGTDTRPHCTAFAARLCFTALLDTGAACSLIRETHWQALRADHHDLPAATPPNILVRGLGTQVPFAPLAQVRDLPLQFAHARQRNGNVRCSAEVFHLNALVIPDQHWSERAGMILGADFLLHHMLEIKPTLTGAFTMIKNGRAVADIFQGKSLTHDTSCIIIESTTPELAAQYALLAEADTLSTHPLPNATTSAPSGQINYNERDTIPQPATDTVTAATTTLSSAATPASSPVASRAVSPSVPTHCKISKDNVKDDLLREAAKLLDHDEQAEIPARMTAQEAQLAADRAVDKICEKIIAAAAKPQLIRAGWTPAHTHKYMQVWKKHGRAVLLPLERVTHMPPDPHKPRLPTSFVIRLVDPYAQTPNARCRTFAHDVEKWLQVEIPRLVAAGIIERCHSATSSPLVVVRKRNGEFRLCVDLRQVNAITVPEAASTPNLQHLLNKIAGHNFFCGLDLRAAFWQIGIEDEATRDLLAFSVAEQGQFRFCRMPFGSRNASAVAEKLMQHVWSSVPAAPADVVSIAYQDDRHTAANDPDHFIAAVEADLLALQQFERPIVLNGDKVDPLTDVDIIFGFEVSSGGTQLAPSQVEAIHRLRAPKTVRELQSIAGAVQWVAPFIPQLSEITTPWRGALAGTDTTSRAMLGDQWTTDCDKALAEVKRIISQRILLTPPILDGTRALHLFSDSSDNSISAVLCQQTGTTDTPIDPRNPTPPASLRPIAFFSKSLSAVQKRWPIQHREAYAIVAALQKFEPWIHSALIMHCWTDSASAMGFFSNPTAAPDRNNKMFRWALQIHQFHDLNVWHIAGQNNKLADVLSRMSVFTVSANTACQAAVAHLSMSVAPTTGTAQQSLDFIELSSVSDKLPATAADWCTAQQADPELAAVLDYMYTGLLPTDPKQRRSTLDIADAVFLHPTSRVLVRKPYERKYTLATFVPRPRIVVPVQLQHTVVDLFHDDALNGLHRGEQETYSRIVERFWWVGAHAATMDHVKNCMDCSQVKSRAPPPRPRPNVVDAPSEPFEVVHIDYLYVNPSRQGNKYLLVLICALTGWVECWPAKTCDADTVLEHLRVDVLARYLRMPRLISDNGSHFTANSLAQLIKEINSEHSFCAPYHPQANGKVERVNRTILEMLRLYAHDWQAMWDEPDTITPLLLQLRASISNSTGFAPYELIYGRERQFSADHSLRAAIETPVHDDPNIAEQQRKRIAALGVAHNKVRQLLNSTHSRLYKDNTAQFTDLPTFQVKDTVWLYHPVTPSGETPKTARLWRGPYIVEKHIVADSYLVRHYKNKSDLQKANASRMIRTSALPKDFDKDKDFEVERFIKFKGKGKSRQVLVKWRYFPSSENSWIAESEAKAAPKAWAAFVRGGGEV